MKISACMIVKNEEGMLKRTLPDLIKSVDEVILVDTGSADGTVEYAKKCGAKVYHFSWINDFAAARNESLKRAQGDWIIWIDADEYIKPEDFIKIREILTQSKEDVLELPIRECKPEEFECIKFYYRAKIFRNNKGYHFTRPINEQVCDKNEKMVRGQQIENVPIYHWGNNVSEEHYNKKKMRNIPILLEVLNNNPKDVNAHYLLAQGYDSIGRLEDAICEYSSVIDLDPKGTLAQTSMSNKAWCFYKLRRGKEAYEAALKSINLDNTDISAYNVIASILIAAGNLSRAAEVLKYISELIANKKEKEGANIWQKEFMAPLLMGQLFEAQGKKEEALAEYNKAAKYDPNADIMGRIERLK